MHKKKFQRRKMKHCKSPETRFAKVSRRSEPCSRGKRPFEVSKKKLKFVTGDCQPPDREARDGTPPPALPPPGGVTTVTLWNKKLDSNQCLGLLVMSCPMG